MATKTPTLAASRGQMVELDETDRRIADALRADSRMSMRTLASTLHISRANAYTRVARLERDGVITGYTATIDPQRYGHALSAYVYLKIQQQSWRTLQRKLIQLPDVAHAALVAGEYDIVLLVRTRDTAALRDLILTRLQGFREVLSTQTEVIFDEITPAPRPPATTG